MTNKEQIMELVQEELHEANKEHPLFQTPHEAYGVILEEVEEVEDELCDFYEEFAMFWEKIKADKGGEDELDNMIERAVNAARECIQVAAMCQKALMSELY